MSVFAGTEALHTIICEKLPRRLTGTRSSQTSNGIWRYTSGLTVNSVSGSGMTVTVNYGSVTCTDAAPTVTLSPVVTSALPRLTVVAARSTSVLLPVPPSIDASAP